MSFGLLWILTCFAPASAAPLSAPSVGADCEVGSPGCPVYPVSAATESPGDTRPLTRERARADGYKGDDLGDGYACYLRRECDAYGFSFEGKDPDEVGPEGLPRHAIRELARAMGYRGSFGGGAFQRWLDEESSRRSKFSDRLQARRDGYAGAFGGGGYTCFKRGECDRHGFGLSGRNRDERDATGLTRGQMQDLARTLGYPGGFGQGGFAQWLTAHPELREIYEERVAARLNGYKGDFRVKGTRCFYEGSCDAYGLGLSGVDRSAREPSGLTRGDAQDLGRSVGYQGPYGGGAFNEWLTGNPQARRKYEERVAARRDGFKGDFGAGAYNCFQARQCDAYGFRLSGRNDAERYASGLTRREAEDLGRSVGYRGAYGEGDFLRWLEEHPAAKEKFESRSAARGDGYQGDFGAGGYACFKRKECDAYGFAHGTQDPNEVGAEGLPRGKVHEIGRGLGYPGAFGQGDFQRWLDEKPGRRAKFEERLQARRGGYEGNFGAGGHTCFLSGECDRHGFAFNGRDPDETGVEGLPRRALHDIGRGLGFRQQYGEGRFQLWLDREPGRRSRFDERIRARKDGYLGDFGSGGYACFKRGECDASGMRRGG